MNIEIKHGLEEAVIVALGSNLAGAYPSTEALLEACLAAFPKIGLRVVKRSSWWRSSAWPPSDHPEYLNGVALVETKLDAGGLLTSLLDLEQAFGRLRGAANAPRTLDLDLIAHGRQILHEEGLTLPHARAPARRFVMGPLAEIAPDWTHPVTGRTASVLADSASVGRDARPIRPTGYL